MKNDKVWRSIEEHKNDIKDTKARINELVRMYKKESKYNTSRRDKHFEELVKLTRSNTFKVLNKWIRNNRYLVEEDLLQEALMTLLKCVERFDTDKSKHFLAFYKTALRNRIVDYDRQQKKIYGIGEDNITIISTGSIEQFEEMDFNEELTILDNFAGNVNEPYVGFYKIIEQLEPYEKKLMQLKFIDDMKDTEIAEELNTYRQKISNEIKEILNKLYKDLD